MEQPIEQCISGRPFLGAQWAGFLLPLPDSATPVANQQLILGRFLNPLCD